MTEVIPTRKRYRRSPSTTSYTLKYAFTSSTVTIRDPYSTKSHMAQHEILKSGEYTEVVPGLKTMTLSVIPIPFFSVYKKLIFPENMTSYEDHT